MVRKMSKIASLVLLLDRIRTTQVLSNLVYL